jgi:hypothetical protein
MDPQEKTTLDAYARYLLMPLPMTRWLMHQPHRDSPTLHFVEWKNPFSHEKNGVRDRYVSTTLLTAKSWCVCTTRSSWGEDSFRHYTKEEFVAKIQNDEKFRSFVGLQ